MNLRTGINAEMATEYIALAALVINAIGALVGLTWGASKIKENVKDELKVEIDALKAIIAEAELAMERRSGELGHALREKITQVEFHVRDNYVREKEFDALILSMNARFDRIDLKLDVLAKSSHPPPNQP